MRLGDRFDGHAGALNPVGNAAERRSPVQTRALRRTDDYVLPGNAAR